MHGAMVAKITAWAGAGGKGRYIDDICEVHAGLWIWTHCAFCLREEVWQIEGKGRKEK